MAPSHALYSVRERRSVQRECTGQPLSRESAKSRVPTVSDIAEGKTDSRVSARDCLDPAWSENLACAEALCAGTGRACVFSGVVGRYAWGRRGAVADDE